MKVDADDAYAISKDLYESQEILAWSLHNFEYLVYDHDSKENSINSNQSPLWNRELLAVIIYELMTLIYFLLSLDLPPSCLVLSFLERLLPLSGMIFSDGWIRCWL